MSLEQEQLTHLPFKKQRERKVEIIQRQSNIQFKLRLPLICRSQVEISIIEKMILVIQASPHVQVEALLQKHPRNQNKLTLSTMSTMQTGSKIQICYSLSSFGGSDRLKTYFQNYCKQIHEILNYIRNKHVISNKYSFWMKKFDERLAEQRKCQSPLVSANTISNIDNNNPFLVYNQAPALQPNTIKQKY